MAKKNNIIYYGDGDIKIVSSETILGFDIKFEGNYNLESYNPDNFMISYNKGRILGVGLGSTLGENAFLKYTGDLKIKECKVVTSDMKVLNITSRLVHNDRFNSVQNNFDGENLQFQNLNKIGVVKGIPNKTTVNIITKNLHTEGNQYKLNGENYTGDYHLHHTGIAMTGSDHTEGSEKLTIQDKKKRIKNIRTAIKKVAISSTGRGGGY